MSIPTGGNLVVPVVLWGKHPPSHTISALALSFDQKTILTGSAEGQICLWEYDSETEKITPKFFLYGHSGSVTCVTASSEQQPYFISASNSGELCLWDIKDGRCIESSKCGHVHTSMQPYMFEGHRSLSLICNGQYPEIYIIDPNTLEVTYALVSRVHPDWVNGLCVIKPPKRNDDVILAVTKSGTIKMWSIDIHTVKSVHIYEDESKQIRCVDAQTIKCCPYNQRTVLIVCSKYWQIYDAGEFSLLCSESSGNGNQWCGGEFIALDKVIVWNNNGQAFLYKLPTNKINKTKPVRPPRPGSMTSANPESSDYHHMVGSKAIQLASPSLYCVIDTKTTKFFEEKSQFVCEKRSSDGQYFVLRADADGSLVWWCINSHPHRHSAVSHIPTIYSTDSMSINQLWSETSPVGLLDNVSLYLGRDCNVTSSIYIGQSARLICGLDDGNIVIIPVISTIRSLFLDQSSDSRATFPLHKMLVGHKARVNCLLYPHNLESRYSPNHLLSGSSDFTVNLWDLSLGQLLHSFTIHAGEISHLYIPPFNCSTRILSCVCSVASDHSVALLSLKERRCLLFASRHMFPVVTIKWRPIEDFMMISCTDSTAYVWQMETGLLDRVVHGVTAVEMLKACDEAAHKVILNPNQTNPQISVSQAMKRRNLASFRNLAQQALQNLENLVDEEDMTSETETSLVSVHNQPLMVQGLQSNPTDHESHVILFDTEALIVLMLCEEFGISSSEYVNNSASQKTKGDVERKITDFISMVKEKAEGLSQLARTEGKGLSNDLRGSNRSRSSSPLGHRRRGSSDSSTSRDSDRVDRLDTLAWEISQTFLSLQHAWSLDTDLDKFCLKKLGLERLAKPVSYGLLSQAGQMVLMLPTLQSTTPADSAGSSKNSYHNFWEVSSALTTQHLLSVISLANMLMSMGNPSFIKQKTSKRYPSSGLANGDGNHSDSASDAQVRQSQCKQAWSLLAALHCVLLPDLVGESNYRSPQLHLLANRWQDRCLEVREAAQALLLAELKRIGPEGRHQVIAEWSPFMPDLKDDTNGSISMAEPENHAPMLEEDVPHINKMNNEKRRQEATAIVMLGVIGSEFGKEIEPNKSTSKPDKLKRVSMEGFGIANHSLAWHTSKALAFLLLNPQQCKLPAHAPLRRAAIDLLGRGFSVWQPYIDVSAVLLGLLEICIDADKVIPSAQSGLPLTPAADACRTARHALTLIATAQPATFLTCMAKEVARYNAVAQNPQSGTMQNTTVLIKAKPEILRVIELLIDKQPNDVADLLIETMDVAVHCLDANSIKAKGLQETFPALCRFAMVSYCTASRRICVGSKNGTMAFYELKQSKAQTISAHKGAVAAVSFSEDGKYLASYSPVDAKVLFWQTASTSLFGIGSAHTKCIKSYSVPWKSPGPPQPNVTRGGRLAWTDSRTITLVLADGSESRYRV